MDPTVVRDKLVDVLRTIQELGGFDDGGSIDGNTVPLGSLKEFDTQIVPVAITLVAKNLGVPIPNDQNVFLSRDGQKRLSVNEVVDRIIEIMNCESKKR